MLLYSHHTVLSPLLLQTIVAQAASSSYPAPTLSPGMSGGPFFSVPSNLSQTIYLPREQIAILPAHVGFMPEDFLTPPFYLLKSQHDLSTTWAIPFQPLHNVTVGSLKHYIRKEMGVHVNTATSEVNYMCNLLTSLPVYGSQVILS